MPLPVGGDCHYHPTRPGIGICVECRQVICADCSTQFEGINRCASCLGKMSRAASEVADRSDWSAGRILTLALVFALLTGASRLVASWMVP